MVKLNKIYTRTGDRGTAGLVDGSRVSKSSLRMTAIGEGDEANAAIGVAIAALDEGPVADQLLEIQNDLFDLGADVATPGEIEGALRIVGSQVERLEHDIMDQRLEIVGALPLGGPAYPSFFVRFGDAYHAELAHFLRFARGQADNPCTAADALEALRIAEAAGRSWREHRPVKLSEIA